MAAFGAEEEEVRDPHISAHAADGVVGFMGDRRRGSLMMLLLLRLLFLLCC
jgi:hypothetical protein